MQFKYLIPFLSIIIFLSGCSASYKQLSTMESKNPSSFQEYLLNEYKQRATFEAEEMHDWNSAKLYSEKALKSLKTDKYRGQTLVGNTCRSLIMSKCVCL